jgi:hypothetical protein
MSPRELQIEVERRL